MSMTLALGYRRQVRRLLAKSRVRTRSWSMAWALASIIHERAGSGPAKSTKVPAW